MEISAVRRRIQAARTAAKERARARRQRADEAERAYERFLELIAVPLTRQVANALNADGYPFTVSTPGRGLRLSFDHGRDDFIELELDTEAERPHIVGRIRRTRGSRTIDEERPVKPDTAPQDITEVDLLEFLAGALEPWLER